MNTRKLQRAVQGFRASAQRSVQTSPFTWSGYSWHIRPNYVDHGPGSNAWSNQNVELDAAGNLYLSLVKRNGIWTCVEIAGPSFGYGRYDFYIASDPTNWDRRPVLGLFTYDDNGADAEYREIDIEITKWSNPLNTSTVWYTMNPIAEANQSSHLVTPSGPYRCSFIWQPGQLYFQTTDSDDNLLGNHLVTAGVFAPATETVRLNLWLYRTAEEMSAGVIAAPANTQPLTVQINRFVFTPNITYTQLAASNFTADFSNGQVDGFDLRLGAKIVANQLVLPCIEASSTPQSTATTGAIIGLYNSFIAIHVTGVPGIGNGSTEAIWQIRYDASNYVSMLYASGNLICRKRENGVLRTILSLLMPHSINIGA